MQELRPYQTEALRKLEASQERRILLTAPTGAGKTTIFSEVIRRSAGRVLILVHRKELVEQASARLRQFNVPHGIIMAGVQPQHAAVQVASVQTLSRRVLPKADLVIVDEAHHARARTWEKILNSYPEARILGFTATPWRLDGKGLAESFDENIVVATPMELTEQGYLVKYSGFRYDRPDLSEVRTRHGDYIESQLEDVMSKPALIGNIVNRWLETSTNLSTVLFAVSVKHAQTMEEAFEGAGIPAETIHGELSKPDREAILRRTADGTTRVLCSVNVVTEGFDLPRLKCAILARPTQSTALYLQMVGRVLRPWEGLEARVHDHAECVSRHGLPDVTRDYSLNSDIRKALNETSTCPNCFAVFPKGKPCPSGCVTCQKCGLARNRKVSDVCPKGCDNTRKVEVIAEGLQTEIRSLSSAEAPPTPAKRLPPKTPVTWKYLGQSVEGVLIDTVPGQYGHDWILEFNGRLSRVGHSTDLRKKLSGVKLGSKISITYKDILDVGRTSPMRVFDVKAPRASSLSAAELALLENVSSAS